MSSHSRALALIATCLLSASACASGDDDDTTGGTAGMLAGADGTAGILGTGGMPAAGTGGVTAGTGGMTAGTGGKSTFTPGSPTFPAIFQEIIVDTGCNGGTLCHAGTVAGNLPMLEEAASYKALVGVKAMGTNLPIGGMPPIGMNCVDVGTTRVVAGDPETSLLMLKLDRKQPCGTPMPPSGPLAPAKVEQIRTWIKNGALEH